MPPDDANLTVLSDGAGGVRLAALPPFPPLAANGVLVRMRHAPVNPADLLAIDGSYAFDLDAALPLGAEGVAMVVAVGAAVTDLCAGALVLPLTRGNWCRMRCLRRDDLILLPSGIDPVQAAMLRINPPTAWLLLRAAGLTSGDILVQNAAGSLVAGWVRRFAADRGVRVIDVVRRADPALPDALPDGDDLAQRVRAAAGDRPIRVALDCVAGAATERMTQCLAPGGRVLLFGHLSGEAVRFRSQLLTGGGLSVTGFSLRPAEAALGPEGVAAMFATLCAFHARRPPDAPVRAVIPLTDAAHAIAQARVAGPDRVIIDLTG